MKIALLLSHISQSGVSTNTLDLARGLIKEGEQVVLITSGSMYNENKEIDNLVNKFKDLGIPIYYFVNSSKITRLRWLKIFIDFYSFLQISLFLLKVKPDMVHACSPYMSFIPKLLRIKFVTTLHIPILKPCFRLPQANSIITISRETQKYALTELDYCLENTKMILHGVDEKFGVRSTSHEIENVLSKFSIPLDKILIGLVGTIEPRKGHDILVQAISFLPNECKTRIHVVFLGSTIHGEDITWLTDQINANDLKKNITFVPYRDPKILYDAFDICVMPSRMEAFGLVAIEAMMSECCTIRSNTEGAYDQIIDGVDGLLFENEDSLALSNILKKVILDADLRTSIAKKGKIKALDYFTKERMVRETLDLYKKILN
ncbi:glycosyltransferase family 4 protein [Halosquirtibacter laminarini]|uniref:Glycosyltransferase family 4 protein n=1 Tax=Halosquirtibacter laminarini TaxID=3374600 RepID=A0AC61NLY0_9BACT|nr:glycosyltransferase family 4 protein [Prolixibacteraceae bacterium]